MSSTFSLGADQSTLALARLGRGLGYLADALLITGFAFFLFDAGDYPRPLLSCFAWLVVALTVAFSRLPRFSAARATRLGYTAVLAACALIVVLDLTGCTTGVTSGPYPAAAASSGALLLMHATLHRTRTTMIPMAVLTLAITIDYLASLNGQLLALGPRMLALAFGLLPPIVGILIVRWFRMLVAMEADRAQTQSTVQSPGIALGPLTSKELAQLDLDAERLLEDVATGRAPLPLSASVAESAASIATELRLNLIAGRGRTWLYHAVSESNILGPIVSVVDPDGLAALLSTRQRDALLSAVWLFTGDIGKPPQTLRIGINAADARGSRLAIRLEADGVPRKQVDPAVWQAISQVGSYTETTAALSLRIDIDCVLPGPA